MMLSRKPKLSRTESLSAKPVKLVAAEVEPTESGARLKVEVTPAKWATWFMRTSKTLNKTFELDSLGMLVWNSCDGKNSVQRIIRKLANQYNLTEREAEVGTVQFLQMLAKKGLVGMAVDQRSKEK